MTDRDVQPGIEPGIVSPLRVPPARVVRGISADGLQVVTWTCPRCEVRHIEDHEVDEDAVRCCACGADFVSDDEPERPPAGFLRSIDIARERLRQTGVTVDLKRALASLEDEDPDA